MIDSTVSKIIELLYKLEFKELFKSSDPSMRFSKQIVGFSAELQNHAYKNLGLAVIIDIKFVPTVTKNKVRIAEVEKIEEKLKKTKSASKTNILKKSIEPESNPFVDENGRIK